MPDPVPPTTDYCRVCLGTGRISLPPPIVAPGVVSLVARFKRCEACDGSGRVDADNG